MDRDDVGVLEVCGGLRLAEETIDVLRPQLPAAGHLDGHDPPQFRVAGLPDRTEGPLAQKRQEFKMGDLLRHLPRGSRVAVIQRHRGVAGQRKAAVTLRAGDRARLGLVEEFDGLMAVGTANADRPGLKGPPAVGAVGRHVYQRRTGLRFRGAVRLPPVAVARRPSGLSRSSGHSARYSSAVLRSACRQRTSWSVWIRASRACCRRGWARGGEARRDSPHPSRAIVVPAGGSRCR